MYSFSKRSIKNLETCEEDLQRILQKIVNLAIRKVDFSVTKGVRTLAQQKKLNRDKKILSKKNNTINKYSDNINIALKI